MYVYVYVYIFIYVYIHIYIYTYIYDSFIYTVATPSLAIVLIVALFWGCKMLSTKGEATNRKEPNLWALKSLAIGFYCKPPLFCHT